MRTKGSMISGASIHAACEVDKECDRQFSDPAVRYAVLGCVTSRVRREGHAEGPQGIHFTVSHRRGWLKDSQVYDRSIWTGHSPPGSCSGTEDLRRETGRAGSSGRETGAEAPGRGGSR